MIDIYKNNYKKKQVRFIVQYSFYETNEEKFKCRINTDVDDFNINGSECNQSRTAGK